MEYQKERLDDFFEEVISIVDSCILDKEIPKIKNFKITLYLSFAAFLEYYGYENIDLIYESFQDTYYMLLTNKSKKSSEMPPKPAYVNTRYQKYDNHIVLEDYLYIIDNKNENLSVWFNCFLHEMNHLINSKNYRVINNRYIRSGVSLYDIQKKKEAHKYLNEAFNTLQTEEIESLIYLFSQEKIVTPYFYQILKKIRKSKQEDMKYAPYPLRTSIIRPLYQDKYFKKVYEENSLKGNIKQIQDEFDTRTYQNGFQDLSDLIEQCNDNIPISEQHEAIIKAKTLVKRYLVS